MSNSNNSTSNFSNKSLKTPATNQPKAPRYVRTRISGMPIAFETAKIKMKRPEDVGITVKQKKFDAWKAHAEKFSWDLFAIPGTLKGGMQGNASNSFHKYASTIIKENGWNNFHAMTLWSLLPEEYKSEWQAAAELGGAQETSKTASPCAEAPKFKEMDHFHDGKCAYFSFEATPALSAPPAVDTGKGDDPGRSRDALPASKESTCDTANGDLQPIPLDYPLDFENDIMPFGQPISPELNVQKSSLTSIPKFDFGPIYDFGVYNIIPSRDSIPPLSPEDLSHDEQRPTKRRRRNSKESTQFTQNPQPLAPSNGSDSLFGLQVPPLSSITPRPQDLTTQRQFNTRPDNLPAIGRESKHTLCHHHRASSGMRPRPPAEVAETSTSLLGHASTSTGVRGQKCGDQYDIGASIFWEYISTVGSGQLDSDNAPTLDLDAIADILSTLTQDSTAEYLTDSLLETQESSNHEVPRDF